VTRDDNEIRSVDVVIPVYNEGPNIIPVLESFANHIRTPFRVLICYDHDDDNTIPAIHGYRNPGLQIALVKNRGVGAHAPVRTGFEASRAPAVLVFPADDTNNSAIVDRMFQKFEEGCDVVCASRFIPGGGMVGCPWLKAVLVRSCAFTLFHFARIPTRDASNGLRLFSKRLLQAVKIESTQGFSYSLELLAKCHRLGWKIGEVPSLWIERSDGSSRFKVLKWAPAYLRWYCYVFATTYLRLGPATVRSAP
jgi:glycosyltransferase involved in cell wall biosynthesis